MEQQPQNSNLLRLDLKRTTLIGLAFLSISMFWQIYDAYMPLFLSTFNLDQTFIGFIMALDSILGLFMLPLFGYLSDSFPSTFRKRLGRRIPFIVVGSVLGGILLIFVNLAHINKNLSMLITMTVFLLIFVNSYRTPAVSLMPDITPKSIRSNANMIINIMGAIGMALALVISMIFKKTIDVGVNKYDMPIKKLDPDNSNWIVFGITASIMIITAIIFVFFVKENKFVKEKNEKLLSLNMKEEVETREKVKTVEVLKQMKGKEIKSLFFILFAVAMWYMAYNAAGTWFTTYSLTILSQSNFELPLLIGNVSAFAMFAPALMLGKKIGRKNTVLIGVGMMVLAFGLGSLLQFTISGNILKFIMFPVFVFVGAGWAAINVHSFVMVLEFSNEKTNGVFTGLYYAFVMSARAITPILSGAIFSAIGVENGLLALLPYCAIFMALAFISMLMVRHGNTKIFSKKNK